MPLQTLDPRDPVLGCVRRARALLEGMAVQYMLTNGHIEKQLKLFVGSAWESRYHGRAAYVMDKRFNRQELDLLAFNTESKPAFWIEAKCGFADDNWSKQKSQGRPLGFTGKRRGGAYAVANRALKQVSDSIKNLPDAIKGQPTHLAACPIYILHFLMELPTAEGTPLPAWTLDKFLPVRKRPKDPKDPRKRNLEVNHFLTRLSEYYAEDERHAELVTQYHSSAIVRLFNSPRVDALIVRIARRTARRYRNSAVKPRPSRTRS